MSRQSNEPEYFRDTYSDKAYLTPEEEADLDAKVPHKFQKHLINGADINPEPPEYLWRPYLETRNHNLLGGKPERGKTFIICALISAVTSGYQPEGMPGKLERSGYVLYFGGEDGNGIIADRLQGFRCDLTKLDLCESPFDISSNNFKDFDSLLKEKKPALVIFDPLTSYMPASIDINNAIQSRQFVDSLRDAGRKHDTCIMSVIHPPKKDYPDLGDRFQGSGGYVQGSRTASYIAPHPDDPTKRVVIQTKNNNAREPNPPIVFSLDYDLGFTWCGSDPNITKRMVRDADEDGNNIGVGSNLDKYTNVLLEVMKTNPKGIDMTANEIASEYKKYHNDADINVMSMGRVFKTDPFKRNMEKQGYKFMVGTRAGNRQKYSCISMEQMVL